MPSLTTAIATTAGAPLLLGAAANGWTVYTVQPRDTVTAIAARHSTDIRTLVRANKLLGGGHLIRAGAKIRVPRAAPAKRVTPRVRLVGYTVRAGDTVDQLSGRFKIDQATIRRTNQINRYGQIYAGQRLRLPVTTAPAQVKRARAAAAGIRMQRYTVRTGDTVSAIAARTRSSVAAVLKANRLRLTSRIHPGQVLNVPARATTSANTFAGRTYPSSIVNAAAANRARLASRAVPGRQATRGLISRTARSYGVDPALALAIAYQESGWHQRQVSVANAIGVMQVIPSSGRWASDLVGRRLDLLDTRDNITAGVVILRALNRSAANQDEAIAGYYQGLSSVQRRGMFADTRRYVANIKRLRAQLR